MLGLLESQLIIHRLFLILEQLTAKIVVFQVQKNAIEQKQ